MNFESAFKYTGNNSAVAVELHRVKMELLDLSGALSIKTLKTLIANVPDDWRLQGSELEFVDTDGMGRGLIKLRHAWVTAAHGDMVGSCGFCNRLLLESTSKFLLPDGKLICGVCFNDNAR